MSSLENYEKDFTANPVRTSRRLIFKIIGVAILVSSALWIWNLVTLPARSAKQVLEKTLNADNIIQNYEWFKQQYNDYLAISVKITQADTAVEKFKREAGNRDKWTFEDKFECGRLTSVADGLRFQRADISAKYNAKSKMINRSLFKSSDLPAELPQ